MLPWRRIAVRPTWQTRHLPDGLALFLPEGRALGGVRIRDHVRPLRRAADLLAEVFADPRYAGVAPAPFARLFTAEGEHAALSITESERFVRAIGLVLGDDFYTRIDAVSGSPAHFALFAQAARELTTYTSLGLGAVRRRRYLHAPPPGWSAYARGLTTLWHSPHHPDDRSLIWVYPARPLAGSGAASALHRTLYEVSWADYTRELLEGPFPFASWHGLRGERYRAAGHFGDEPRVFSDVIVVSDARFAYPLRKDSPAPGDHEALFEAVAASIEPLPAPVSDPTPEDHVSHWVS